MRSAHDKNSKSWRESLSECSDNTKAASTPQLPDPVSGRRPGRSLAAKLLITAEWLALLAGISYLCVRTLPRAWQKLDTDFPNYYLTARLLHGRYDTDRIYEWIWMQRQKDHIKMEKADQAVVAFVSLTSFSALLAWPLTAWAPLPAKHIWIAFNLALLVPVGFFIKKNSVDDRRTHANCNDVSPSWEADSRTLLFASDCGCAFGLTALYRQRVLP